MFGRKKLKRKIREYERLLRKWGVFEKEEIWFEKQKLKQKLNK